MKRLLQEKPTDKSPSTGVVEKVIQVRVEKSSSIISASVEDSKWTRLTLYDDEAVEMMKQVTARQITVKPYKSMLEGPQDSSEVEHDTDTRQASEKQFNTDQVQTEPLKHQSLTSIRDKSAYHHPKVCKEEFQTNTYKSLLEVFKNALKSRGLQGLSQHLKEHWSLYLSNTGGQMEFQELLPLLVSGPSLIFFTFRLDRDLHQRYEIEYEVPVKNSDSINPKSFKYTSSATPLETMLQTLASIDTVSTYDYSNQERERIPLTYKVFIIGTHRDILENNKSMATELKIKEIDEVIHEAVRVTSYFRHIEFAAKDQLIFTVNNFSEVDSDFLLIRSSVQQVIHTGYFSMTTPSHWLIYSLVLRQNESRVESYDNCFRIARDCGITDHDEHKEALHFIHTKMGVIHYFPQNELDQIVILDPQVLFDEVTEFITETFTFEQAGYHAMEDFKKGIFCYSDFEMVSHLKRKSSDPLLIPSKFAKLLEHLRIVAPFYHDGILKYFFPCALSHADEQQSEQSIQTAGLHLIPPLVVSFGCGYRPVGLAGALIKYLMTNERQSKDFKWKLLTDNIYRDQVSFLIEPSCDTVVLKMFTTHLEVICISDPNDSDRSHCPIDKTCTEVWKSIKAGIERVNSDINYIRNTEPSFTFYCQVQGCTYSAKPHPAKLLPGKLFCPKSNKSCKLPKGYKTWMLQELTTQDHAPYIPVEDGQETDIQCNMSHHSLLLTQLSEHAANWRDIGTHLGFRQGELNIIKCAPLLLQEAPKSWLSAMLSEWLEWAPGDQRGSTRCATLNSLKSALKKAGLGRTAQELTLQEH